MSSTRRSRFAGMRGRSGHDKTDTYTRERLADCLFFSETVGAVFEPSSSGRMAPLPVCETGDKRRELGLGLKFF